LALIVDREERSVANEPLQAMKASADFLGQHRHGGPWNR
jgi:hypothetical protein